MLEHAVVGLDHSSVTGRLAEELQLLPRLGVTRATLVTVLGGHYPNVPQESHRDHFLSLLEQTAAQLGGFDTSCEVRSGYPAAELRETAEESGADVIVVGSHGHTPWRDLFLGSTVLELVRTSRTPILLLPLGPDHIDRGGGVLLATDGSSSAAAAEQVAVALGEDLGGAAVTVVTRPDDAEVEARASAHLEQLAARSSLSPVVEQGPLPEAIGALAEKRGSDVIVVGARGRNPLTGLLLGSTAEHLLRTANRPILLVPGSR